MAKIKRHPRSRSHDHPFKPRSVSHQAFSQVYWPYLPVLALIFALASMLVHSGGQTVVKHPTKSVLAYASSMNNQKLLADTNQQRSKNNEPTLVENSQLDAAASTKAQDMAKRDYWSHSTPDGQPPWVFVTNQNYSYQKLGENLAAGFDNEQAAIDGWMASTSHRENILNSSYSQVGFGIARSANYKAAGGGPMTIVVAYYAQPGSPSAPVVKAGNTSNVSWAQLALAKLPMVSWATYLVLLISALAVGVWFGRRFIKIKKALKKGERYVFSHPLLDVGLVVIAVLSYMLSQTAGLIH